MNPAKLSAVLAYMEWQLPIELVLGAISGWENGRTIYSYLSVATREDVRHVHGCPSVDCEACDLENLLSNCFSSKLRENNRTEGLGKVRIEKNGEITTELLADDSLVAVIKAQIRDELRQPEFEGVDGLQMDIHFGPNGKDYDITYLQRKNRRWSASHFFLDGVYFLALRETNGNNIQRMIVHLQGDDFWIASDPPKPQGGWRSVDDQCPAQEGQIDGQGPQYIVSEKDPTGNLLLKEVDKLVQGHLKKGEAAETYIHRNISEERTWYHIQDLHSTTTMGRLCSCCYGQEPCDFCNTMGWLSGVVDRQLDSIGKLSGAATLRFEKGVQPQIILDHLLME